jgi:hypothetical protein
MQVNNCKTKIDKKERPKPKKEKQRKEIKTLIL